VIEFLFLRGVKLPLAALFVVPRLLLLGVDSFLFEVPRTTSNAFLQNLH
jgi:hypothetical protein